MKREELSALVDGEIAAEEIEPLLDTLAGDSGARRAWSRYHLIGDTLRAHAAEEPHEAAAVVASTVAVPPPRSWRLPLSGLAAVAAVAVVAAVLTVGNEGEVGLELAGEQGLAAPPMLETLAPPPVASISDGLPAALTPVGVYDERLNGYLVNFNERRTQLGMPGVHPYVRIVGFAAP